MGGSGNVRGVLGLRADARNAAELEEPVQVLLPTIAEIGDDVFHAS